MKYLGHIKITLLKERQDYKELFLPLSESEYADLRESIEKAGIVNDLIVEKSGDGYLILSGHHRKAIAQELGLEVVPCSLAETPAEIVEALFDNVSRRQMTEAERKEKIKEKEKFRDRLYEEGLIPEIYELYKEGKISTKSVDEFVDTDPEVQRSIFHCLSMGHPVALGYDRGGMGGVQADHPLDIGAEQRKLTVAEAQMKEAQADLEQREKELADTKKRVKRAIAKYEKDKDQITVEVKKQYEKEIAGLEKERQKREEAVKAKQQEIAELNGKIQSLTNRIYGLDSQVALWRHEIARISETYNNTIGYYSNPALLEVQLQVISEYVEALIRFAKCHKWGEEALHTVEKYDRSIGEFLQKLVKEVQANQKEVVTLESSERAVTAQAGARIEEAVTAA